MANVDVLARMFGSSKALADAAGVHKSAVTRWKTAGYAISPRSQRRIVKRAVDLGIDYDRVAKAVGMSKCPNCGTYH